MNKISEKNVTSFNDPLWQFQNSLKNLNGLSSLKLYNDDETSKILENSRFSLTPYYMSLIKKWDKTDPVFQQCIPQLEETEFSGLNDPLDEEGSTAVPGIIHRYPDRVVALLTNRCAMYCRHCNRRRFWNRSEADTSRSDMDIMLKYINENSQLREVIISGGDPLVISADNLEYFLNRLNKISHIEVIRIGSRLPVTLPMAITNELCKMLNKYRPLWLNTQFNHPNEITPESAGACDRLLMAGIPVSNQSVLLKGINDDVYIMKMLLTGLEKIMVRPYYIFHCEDIKGAGHFRTKLDTGIKIIEKLRGNIGGLCIPTYCIDTPGSGGKIPLNPDYILALDQNKILLKNYCNKIFEYKL
jgi:lysine 2,3-aminomutase